MRQPYQILVIPFRRNLSGTLEFCAFQRADDGNWQGIAGGGETGETPAQAAIREAFEEAEIPPTQPFYSLDTRSSIPKHIFPGSDAWSRDVFVIPEYALAVDCTGIDIILSKEHLEFIWDIYEKIQKLLFWDSNQTALWELNERLTTNRMCQINPDH